MLLPDRWRGEDPGGPEPATYCVPDARQHPRSRSPVGCDPGSGSRRSRRVHPLSPDRGASVACPTTLLRLPGRERRPRRGVDAPLAQSPVATTRKRFQSAGQRWVKRSRRSPKRQLPLAERAVQIYPEGSGCRADSRPSLPPRPVRPRLSSWSALNRLVDDEPKRVARAVSWRGVRMIQPEGTDVTHAPILG